MGKIPLKIERTLRALLQRPRTTRDLEAAPTYDHCSPSTIRDLRRKGINISSQLVPVAGFAGQPARVARYEIQPESLEAAKRLLAELES